MVKRKTEAKRVFLYFTKCEGRKQKTNKKEVFN